MGGKYNLVQVTDGKEICLFSNNPKNTDAVIAQWLGTGQYKAIKERIIS